MSEVLRAAGVLTGPQRGTCRRFFTRSPRQIDRLTSALPPGFTPGPSWEDRRVSLRCRVVWSLGLLGLILSSPGCSDSFNAGPLAYVDNEALTQDNGKTNLAGKLTLQAKVRAGLAKVFGASPQHIRVPEGSGLPNGGIYLANYMQEGEGESATIKRVYWSLPDGSPDYSRPQAGGYAIYRRNCLHCHGVSGAGDGPTSPFLFPAPAIIARASSNSRPLPAVPGLLVTTCGGRSSMDCTAVRCPRSSPS